MSSEISIKNYPLCFDRVVKLTCHKGVSSIFMVNTRGVIIAKTTQMTIHSRLKTLLTMQKKQKQIANLFPKKLLFFHSQSSFDD